MADANIRAVITAKDEASAVLKRVEGNISSVGNTALTGLGNAVKTAAAIGAVALTGLAGAAYSSVKAFEESQNVAAQLGAVLKSTGGVAGVTSDAAIKLSKSLQQVTKFSDEDVLSAENLLLTFTKITKDIFPQATKTVLNMATALGEDTKSAAIQLGKALQDPVLGITALRRVGVNFNDAQKEVIKNLVATGQSAKAQAIILKELDVEFGGSAEAAGKTFAGQLARLKNNINDVQEALGQLIVKALGPFVSKLADFVSSDRFAHYMEVVSAKIQEFADKLFNFLRRIWPDVKKAFKEMAATFSDWIIPAIKDAHDWIVRLHQKYPLLLDVIGIMAAVGVAFTINPFVTFVALALAAITTLHANWENVTNFFKEKLDDVHKWIDKNPMVKLYLEALRDVVADIGKQVTENLVPAIDRLLKALGPDFTKKLKEAGKELVVAIGVSFLIFLGTLDLIIRALAAVIDYIGRVVGALNNLKKSTDLGSGIKNLLKADLSALGFRAEGGPVNSGAPYIVGERGPELFVPKGSGTIVPNGGGGTTYNITVQAGAFMGNPADARRYAQMIADAMKDVAGKKNQTAAQMLGA